MTATRHLPPSHSSSPASSISAFSIGSAAAISLDGTAKDAATGTTAKQRLMAAVTLAFAASMGLTACQTVPSGSSSTSSMPTGESTVIPERYPDTGYPDAYPDTSQNPDTTSRNSDSASQPASVAQSSTNQQPVTNQPLPTQQPVITAPPASSSSTATNTVPSTQTPNTADRDNPFSQRTPTQPYGNDNRSVYEDESPVIAAPSAGDNNSVYIDNDNNVYIIEDPEPSASRQALLERARQNSSQTAAQARASSNNSNLPAFQSLMNDGVNALQSNRLSDAEASFTRAQRLAPQSSAVYFYLGQVAIKKNQPHKAEAMARRGLVVAEDTTRRRSLWQIILMSGQMQNNARVVQEAKNALR